MKVGMLWFDNDPGRNMAQKVGRAARHYRQKFGRQPNVCYVHPSMLDGDSCHLERLKIAPKSSILKHHFWIGEEEVNLAVR
ncbi:MAG: hypothetical protein JW900_02095 [Anaerolineae bacterium]|nr:hypothetical protein [Anaerolineae bacterium]